MPLDQARLTALHALLQDCTACITTDAGSRGSGFFIDELVVLTCAHVVKPGGEVDVHPYRSGHPLKGDVVEYLPGNDVDLAVIKVRAGQGGPRPAVVLDATLHDDGRYYAVGYPKNEVIAGTGQEGIVYFGHPKRDNTDGNPQLLILDAGKSSVTPGLSGGPVLSEATGAVVALVQYAEATTSDSGGGSIPITRAARNLDVVRGCLEDPPTAARRWRDTLGETGWQELGRTWGWERRIDLYLQGDRTQWTVRLDPDDAAAHVVTVHDLSYDAAEALFQWAQRGSARKAEQVQLLGKLLSEALFPSAVMARIVKDRLADSLLIRLHIDDQLFDVPWEFVTIDNRHIAAERGVGIVRIGKHAQPAETTTAPRPTANVLAIIMQPENWHEAMPSLIGSSPVPWPGSEEMPDRLRKAVPSSQIELSILSNPRPFELQGHLEEHRDEIDVVHYIGFGQHHDHGTSLALSDGAGDVKWYQAADIFEWAARSGARVIIVELLLPRSGSDPDPIPAQTFNRALTHRVNAVIFTRLPVHPRQIYAFNESLYKHLGEGMRVEEAVQKARSTLFTDQVLSDAAGFAWFTLLTGPKSGMRLVFGAASSPERGVKQQTQTEQAPPVEARSRPAAATFDRGGS